MPYPVILLEKQSQLGRKPTPEDFGFQDRTDICVTLASCITMTENLILDIDENGNRRVDEGYLSQLTRLQDEYVAYRLSIDSGNGKTAINILVTDSKPLDQQR